MRGEVTVTSSKGTATITDSGGEVAGTGGDATSLSALGDIKWEQVQLQRIMLLLSLMVRLPWLLTHVLSLGAYQSRFESIISSLRVASENASASRSRVMDADFAAETAALTKNQILSQAGISVLAQANAQPQQVLALLQ